MPGLSIKNFYRSFISNLERNPEKLDRIKTRIAENVAIYKKRSLYSKVNWTKEQKKEFDDFWLSVYGKKIPNKWNRLYESFNGKYCVDYIPEKIYTTEIEPALNDSVYARVLEDKSLIETVCSDCGAVFPETVCVSSAGRFYDKNRSPITEENAVRLIEFANDVVLKPTVGGSSGKGILFFDCFSSLSKEEKQNAIKSMGSEFIVQKRIKMSPAFAALNPSSVNTVRIITYIISGEIFHVPLVLRIGRSGKNVDNIHSGGLSIGLNDDGTLLEKAFELNYGDKNIAYDKHPDRDIVFKDYTLPRISGIIEAAKTLHGKYPHIGIISWDFTVNENEEIVLIEANIKGQSIWFPQILHGKGAFGENTKAVFNEVKRMK